MLKWFQNVIGLGKSHLVRSNVVSLSVTIPTSINTDLERVAASNHVRKECLIRRIFVEWLDKREELGGR